MELDRQVAEVLGLVFHSEGWEPGNMYEDSEGRTIGLCSEFSPSTNWSQGGPLIEKYEIVVQSYGPDFWKANIPGLESSIGRTYLSAAMKALVAKE